MTEPTFTPKTDPFPKAVYQPKWLIIVGTNQNAGKTTFATKVIKKFSDKYPITAIKISPHFHPLDVDACILARTGNYVIIREHKTGSGKDSARMLKSGPVRRITCRSGMTTWLKHSAT
jgi:molybdopterin-guanine dinucleotide biosynthesis protein